MIKVGFSTGLAWLHTIRFEGSLNDDIGALIDDYMAEHDDEPMQRFTYKEALRNSDFDDDVFNEEYHPINGGEYYVGRIEVIEEEA